MIIWSIGNTLILSSFTHSLSHSFFYPFILFTYWLLGRFPLYHAAISILFFLRMAQLAHLRQVSLCPHSVILNTCLLLSSNSSLVISG